MFRTTLVLALLTFSSSLSATEPRKSDHKTIENSLGMKLVLIPDGEFLMGSEASPEALERLFPNHGKDRHGESRFNLPDEGPIHTVRITKPFYMGQHELTVDQFRKFLKEANYTPESIADGTGGYGFLPNKPEGGDAFDGRDPKYSWQNPGFKQTGDHPVVNVTWNDAQALCEWLSNKEGKKYRLPTEAEWEYCCRAGTRTHFSSGDEPKSLLKFANTYDLETVKNFPQWKEFALQASDGFAFTSPVGSFAPNGFGLYDMHGNVWEWCSDWYGEDYYSKSPVNDPRGPESGKVKVRRGGSWHTWPFYCRSSFRNWNTARTRYVLVGIRLVRETE